METIRREELDILWIASNVAAATTPFVLLAANRLAPMQVASVCSCVTTGFRSINFYVFGEMRAASGAQEHYSEKLLMIDGPAHCFDFATETTATHQPIRGMIWASTPTRLFSRRERTSPRFFLSWKRFQARILSDVPGSRLLLYPFNPNWRETYPAQPSSSG